MHRFSFLVASVLGLMACQGTVENTMGAENGGGGNGSDPNQSPDGGSGDYVPPGSCPECVGDAGFETHDAGSDSGSPVDEACGDNTCDSDESCASCPEDCDACPPLPTCGSTMAPPTTYDHVVVIMEENRTWSKVGGVGFKDSKMPYLKSLADQCTVFADWTETNTGQNSLTQYIGLTSGYSNTSTVDDCKPSTSCRSTDNNIFRQVRLAGGTARNYVDGATQGCSASGNAAKHIPALYYYGTYQDAGGVTRNDNDFCDAEVRPLSEFNVNALPTFAMISPDLCNDGHDCGNDKVDSFAKGLLEKILASPTYNAGRTAVFVLYDEDHPVPNLFIAPTANANVNTTPGAGHAAMLRTWQEMLGLPVLKTGQLNNAISLRSPAHL